MAWTQTSIVGPTAGQYNFLFTSPLNGAQWYTYNLISVNFEGYKLTEVSNGEYGGQLVISTLADAYDINTMLPEGPPDFFTSYIDVSESSVNGLCFDDLYGLCFFITDSSGLICKYTLPSAFQVDSGATKSGEFEYTNGNIYGLSMPTSGEWAYFIDKTVNDVVKLSLVTPWSLSGASSSVVAGISEEIDYHETGGMTVKSLVVNELETKIKFLFSTNEEPYYYKIVEYTFSDGGISFDGSVEPGIDSVSISATFPKTFSIYSEPKENISASVEIPKTKIFNVSVQERPAVINARMNVASVFRMQIKEPTPDIRGVVNSSMICGVNVEPEMDSVSIGVTVTPDHSTLLFER